jgi:hypothetical protein
VRFTVQQTVQFDPPVVQLGVVSHREPIRVKATITLRDPIQEVRVLPHSEWDVAVTPKGKDQREVVATPTRPGMPRFVNDPFQVVPVGTDGQDRPARPLILSGEVKPDVVGSPSEVVLGRVRTGATCVEGVRLISLTRRKFELVRIASESPDVTVHPDASLGGGHSVSVVVRGTGDQVRVVSAKVRQDDGSELTVMIPIRFHGEQEGSE